MRREDHMEIVKEEEEEAVEVMDLSMVPSRFRRICVFCGSSQGKKKSYQDAAVELGEELVSRNIDLVYGGGSVGLMGLVSRAVYNGGRHVIGYVNSNDAMMITGETVGEVKAVADMHERKAEMARQSDAFIALPGTVGLLNVDGYYNSLLSFIDKAVEEEFISPTARHIIVLAPTPKELLDKLEVTYLTEILLHVQEYSPRHEKVVPKMQWEMEQLSYCKSFEIPGLKEGTKPIIQAQRGTML
ncbi:hypothetical protein HU200_032557 [Digitaria exilis]|uniref:Cytokinin riboside 5'-monophosphate phosphoribohydrolase n=1 Tax=Digitaria exilis TaxID=1010633 RepID=A0A835BMU8_9POAL|nr:hypothetical protein HU200_032557 [Digitaria exilis]